jgi:hypothetical protein
MLQIWGGHSVKIFSSAGSYEYSIGSTQGDGAGQFNTPYGIAVDNNGKIYVADSNNHRVQIFTASGTYDYSITGFSYAYDVSLDSDGYIYVSDLLNRVKVFTNAGILEYSFNGSTEAGNFNYPSGVDTFNGKIYVVERMNNRVQVFNAPVNAGYTIENGNIGIGRTTAPSDKLEVNGTVKINDALKLTPISSAPSNPSAGWMYFDSNDNTLKVFDGTSWQNCW